MRWPLCVRCGLAGVLGFLAHLFLSGKRKTHPALPGVALWRISPFKLVFSKADTGPHPPPVFRVRGHTWTWRPLMGDPSSLSTDQTAEIP